MGGHVFIRVRCRATSGRHSTGLTREKTVLTCTGQVPYMETPVRIPDRENGPVTASTRNRGCPAAAPNGAGVAGLVVLHQAPVRDLTLDRRAAQETCSQLRLERLGAGALAEVQPPVVGARSQSGRQSAELSGVRSGRGISSCRGPGVPPYSTIGGLAPFSPSGSYRVVSSALSPNATRTVRIRSARSRPGSAVRRSPARPSSRGSTVRRWRRRSHVRCGTLDAASPVIHAPVRPRYIGTVG